MIRRILLMAAMVVVLWAAPAHAASYGDIMGQSPDVDRVVITSTSGVTSASAGGDLATTGRNDLVPLVQGSIVLIGGGVLLVLVARRRYAARHTAA